MHNSFSRPREPWKPLIDQVVGALRRKPGHLSDDLPSVWTDLISQEQDGYAFGLQDHYKELVWDTTRSLLQRYGIGELFSICYDRDRDQFYGWSRGRAESDFGDPPCPQDWVPAETTRDQVIECAVKSVVDCVLSRANSIDLDEAVIRDRRLHNGTL